MIYHTMNIDRERIRELVGVAFAEGGQEGRVPTIELISQAACDAQRSKMTDPLEISTFQSRYILMYIGKDGGDYSTYRALFEANQRWRAVNYPKITRDPYSLYTDSSLRSE